MRNGPNPIVPGSGHHWFVRDGMVHGISIKDGRAEGYRNRWIRTQQVEDLLGLPAARVSPNQPMQQGSGNVNVIRHGGRILALPEIISDRRQEFPRIDPRVECYRHRYG